MSDIKYLFAAVSASAFLLFAGCSIGASTSSDELPIENETIPAADTTVAVTEPIVTLTKETLASTSLGTTVSVETTVTTEEPTAYVAATDYATFEGAGFDDGTGTHKNKPVTSQDLYITVEELGVMPGYTLDWTGVSPWSSIYITDAEGNYYVYDRDNGNGTAVDQTTGKEYKFDVVTSGSLIDGFVIYNFPQSSSYTITVNGSASVTGSDYPLPWSGFTIYA